MGAEYPWERPLGARPLGDGRVEFRVWAPRAEHVALRLSGEELPLSEAGYGVYEVVAPARAGDDYLFVLDGEAFPDPCSRFQPDGPARTIARAGTEPSAAAAPSRPRARGS